MKSTIFFKNTTPELILFFPASIYIYIYTQWLWYIDVDKPNHSIRCSQNIVPLISNYHLFQVSNYEQLKKYEFYIILNGE